MNETYIAKTFYEVIGKFNPYHDRLGRFASGGGFMASNWTGDKDKQAVTFSANPNTTYGARAIARESANAHETIGRAYGAGPSTATKPPKSSKPTEKPQQKPKPKTEKPKTQKPKEDKVEFTPAKTKKEATSYAKEKLGFEKVSYGNKMDIDTINHINKQIATLQAKYPEFKGAVQELKTASSKRALAYVETSSDGSMKLAVSSYHYGRGLKSVADSYEIGVKHGFHPKGTTAKDIITHEYGHVYANIQTKNQYGVAAKHTISMVDDRFNFIVSRKSNAWDTKVRNEAAKSLNTSPRALAEKISKYAKTNAAETFAEAFAEFNGSSNPRPECIAIMKAAGILK